MKAVLTFFLMLFPILTEAQFSDNFSDGDFTKNPVWSGNVANFSVYSNQLKVSVLNKDTFYLSTPSTLSSSAQWEFLVRFPNTSTAFSRVYLTSDKSNLKDATLNGYYLDIEDSAKNIVLKLKNKLKILISWDTLLFQSSDTFRIFVTRDNTGKWGMYADIHGGYSFKRLDTTKSTPILPSSYFGVWATNSGTASKTFYWDDFKVDSLDNSKLKINSIFASNDSTINVTFNKYLDVNSTTNLMNYWLKVGTINPKKDTLIHGQIVRLMFKPGTFDTITTYYLNTNGTIKELNGTPIVNLSTKFQYHPASPKGLVVINELYPNTYHTHSLPATEYIELYNAAGKNVDMTKWKIANTSDTVKLTNYVLSRDSFLILCPLNDTGKFSKYGNVLGLTKWLTLLNSGDVITLWDSSGKKISSVNYNSSYYGDKSKANGGWALEKIDPTDTCSGIENWKASLDSSGGTPGKQNSIYGTVKDTTAPKIISYSLTDSVSINLVFSEKLNISKALGGIYILDSVKASSVKFSSSDFTSLLLKFPNKWKDTTKYSLSLQGVEDCHGNSDTDTFSFWNFVPQTANMYDVVINEIMADPKPAQGLPVTEYVELYNRGGHAVNLKKWYFADAYKFYRLPEYLLPPDSYVVLCGNNTDAELLKKYGNVLVSGLPYLNNDADTLSLADSNKYLIDLVGYSSDWYGDAFKKQGGWSLELIDPHYPCSKEGNWIASTDKKGGTPGHINSVNGTNPDISKPKVIKIIPEDSTRLAVYFTKTMDYTSLINPANYKINNGSIKVDSVNIYAAYIFRNFFRKIIIYLSKPLKINVSYDCSITGIADCSGNMMENYTTFIGLPLKADSFDIIINEILFNPNTGGVDFVELYNRSNKIINLEGMQLSDSSNFKNNKTISQNGYLLMPSDYVVLCTNAGILESQYYVKSPEKILVMPSIPTFPNSEGNVILLKKDGTVLDQLKYSDKWHYPLLNSTNGVSLEKINPTLITQQQDNWHSAASSVGFATPTYQNSEYVENKSAGANKINIDPAVFSPDDDGFQDVLNIAYKTGQAGYTIQIDIFDAAGRYICKLANNQTLSTEGVLHWDGLTDTRAKAPIGIYIVLVQLFNPKGEMETYKIPVTLAGKL